MISLEKNADVVVWLANNSSRPKPAMKIWANMLARFDIATGEVLMTRTQMAEAGGCLPQHVSGIMKDLAYIDAVKQRYAADARSSKYLISEAIAPRVTQAMVEGELARKWNESQRLNSIRTKV